MSDVTPINGASSPALSSHARAAYKSLAREAGPVRGADQVELSEEAKYMSSLIKRNDIREDLVDRVRSEIANNTYETPDKVDAAIEEILNDLA